MRHHYAVELRMGAGDAKPPGIVITRVTARDRFEAVAIARRYIERQHPQLDLAKIDTWFIPKRLD